MALRSCRECGAKVSTSAGKCPRCGVHKPTTGMIVRLIDFLLALALKVIFVAAIMWVLFVVLGR